MTVCTYIFIHDQEILLDFKKNNKFGFIKNLKYVFLGNNDISKIENNDDVIICRNLPYNIEKYPKLVTFTGWYALWKNNLIKDDYINLFEYDIILKNYDILERDIKLFTPNIIGYIPLEIRDYTYIGNNNWSEKIRDSILKNYDFDIKELLISDDNYKVSVTSNHTFKKEIFKKYMEWVEIMINDISGSFYAGHEIERSISLFYLINKIPNVSIYDNFLYHFQFDSHHTQDINDNKINEFYNRLINNEIP